MKNVFGYTSSPTNPMGRFISALPTILRGAFMNTARDWLTGLPRSMGLSDWSIMRNTPRLSRRLSARRNLRNGNVIGKSNSLKNSIRLGVICTSICSSKVFHKVLSFRTKMIFLSENHFRSGIPFFGLSESRQENQTGFRINFLSRKRREEKIFRNDFTSFVSGLTARGAHA